MVGKCFKKTAWAGLLVLLCFSLFLPSARAEEAPDWEKGALSAQSGELDRSSFSDGSAYLNEATAVQTVRIGLRYEDTAAYEAVLENLSGGGFAFGRYDADRNFVEFDRCADSAIMVIGYGENPIWHILLNARFENREEAEIVAELYGGQVIRLGEYDRVFFEAYRKWDDAYEEIREYELGARPFADAAPALRVVSLRDSRILYRPEDVWEELAVLPLSESGETLTAFRDEIYRGGFAFRLFENDRLTVINSVGLEDYVKGVIPYEMDPAWPLEALRAQAVCARTYVVYNQNAYEPYGFDLTDNTECQVYKGCREANAITDYAAESTANQLIRYQGEICEIYYFAADGGSTEDGIHVFQAERPYLSGKLDPFERTVDYPLRSWEVRYNGAAIAALLQRRGYEIGPIRELTPSYSENGNVIAITFLDESGTSLRIEDRPCYTSLRLNSCHFTVAKDGEEFVFSGGGLGHSCGLSQWGAYAMALNYHYNYEDIIRFYYTGAYIA